MNEFPLIHKVIPFEQDKLSLGIPQLLKASIIKGGNLIKRWSVAETFTFVEKSFHNGLLVGSKFVKKLSMSHLPWIFFGISSNWHEFRQIDQCAVVML